MQAPFGASTLDTLAICGWTERTPALLRALEAQRFVPVAIGDPSAASLAAASIALRGRLTCTARYQHPREMLRRGPGSTVLLDLFDAATEAAAAASRGSAVLLTGDALEPDTLAMLARTGGSAAVLRPLWHQAPITAAMQAARSLARLRTASITVDTPEDLRLTAGDLTTLAAHLAGTHARSVVAHAYGPPRGRAQAIVTEVEFNDGTTALLTARQSQHLAIEVVLSSFTTTITGTGDAYGGTLATRTGGSIVTVPLVPADSTALAVSEALDTIAGGGIEPADLFAEADLLRSFEAALEGVTAPPVLNAVVGGGQRTAPRRGHLHLVGV